MNKVIYLSDYILSGINAISSLSNDEEILEHLQPIDHHFTVFSTLYQSGVDYIQVNKSLLPEKILNNPFWGKKLIDTDQDLVERSLTKAFDLLKDNFDHEGDRKFLASQYQSLLSFFSDFFYSTQTGIPFVNPKYSSRENFNSLESRLTKELFHSIDIFFKQSVRDNATGITPQYAAIKNDIKRFQEISESIQYTKYSESLYLLNSDSKIDSVKRNIRSSALKIHSKYANHISLKDIGFAFLKLNKKLLDFFTNKPISIIGDSLISSAEKLSKNERQILYYKVEEAHPEIQFANRFGEFQSKVGSDAAGKVLDKFKNNR